MKPVRATVKSGECNQGFHKVGDSWTIGNLTPEGMCTSAFDALFPLILTLQCGGKFFWEGNKNVTCASCPDDTGLVFEVRLADE
ncbi:hypothetical protein AMJ39_01365 [candidate division TA06 bacterium DG_24]|uniref:TIGR04076 family protein n=3 Tax=Bacteria division TA06 TaxID=1156500 RepID=A0A0S8JP02_UNCT6|nr:MAG: hypothetical protein AMJ39_01365 [candidate division TA06 bacterium DG_24]KPK71230.1 MAG: hypothetical protein AMJ82_01540 [candidate division TA06 bacterium SM23_40]KPL11479.1 MAG: hypothetical protein AMJ71_00765 [candidate division TA06 bacterium SM1_40]